MRAFAIVVLFAACSSRGASEPEFQPVMTIDARPPDAPPPAKAAGHNEVCRAGTRSGNPDPMAARACEPGLECCYPCGIEGCDWVCHTPAECAVDRRRP
jgi:hypothetical protein